MTARDAQRARLVERRAQIARARQEMVDDVAHWNRMHPAEEPLDPETADIDRMLSEIDRKLGIH